MFYLVELFLFLNVKGKFSIFLASVNPNIGIQVISSIDIENLREIK